MSNTDPSGHFFASLLLGALLFSKTLRKFWTTIVSIALYAIPGIGVYLAIAFNVALGAARGGVKGALLAAFGIAMTVGIGDAFGEEMKAQRLKVLLPAASRRGIHALLSFQERISLDLHEYITPQQAAGNV